MKRVRLPVVVLQSLCNWVKEPLLGLSILHVSLKLDIVGSNTFSNSLHWKSGSDKEWSVSVETEIFVKSFTFSLSSLVGVEDSPLLMVTSIVAPNTNGMTFFVLTSFDVKDLVVLPVDELFTLVLEDLPPSGVSTPDLHVVGSTRACDVP